MDLGLLKIALPEGYRAAPQKRSIHGGAAFASGSRGLGLSNGYWGPSSFMDEAGSSPRPACEFEVDGIPISVYVLGDAGSGGPPGITSVAAIVKYPERPEDAMVMQSLVSANIRNGDMRHAADLLDLIRSIRKGDPDTYIHALGERRRSRTRID